ncbi:hypothetical protein HK098_005159 [Nowakowskiella sp. JEL0407]|nr:hypothetical protein HK098_005159 [Nowakowskiella sp. JEL0407]
MSYKLSIPILFCVILLLANHSFAYRLRNRSPKTPHSLEKRQPADPCTVLNTPLLVKYTDALACLDSFQISPAIRKQIIATTGTFFQLYPYLDVVKQSPETGFPSSVDVMARLDQISKKAYRNERLFHEDITKLYIDLRDAHAHYSHCYDTFYWTQPWSIIAEYPNSGAGKTDTNVKPTLKIDSLVTNNSLARYRPLDINSFVPAFKTALGFDPAAFVGAQILEIENQPAVNFVLSAASNSSMASVKDISGRFNAMLSSSAWYYGKFVLNDVVYGTSIQLDTILHKSPTVLRSFLFTCRSTNGHLPNPKRTTELALRDLEKVGIAKRNIEPRTVPKVSTHLSHEALRDWHVYLNDFDSINTTQIMERITKIPENIKESTNSNRIALSKGKFAVVNPQPLLVSNNTAFYGLDGSCRRSCPAVNLHRMAKKFRLQTTMSQIGLMRCQKGGGLICISYLMMRFLFSDIQYPIFDMRRSDLLVALATGAAKSDTGLYTSNDKTALKSNKAFKSNSIDWTDTRTTPPGYSGNYTQQFELVADACSSKIPELLKLGKKSGIKTDFWKASNIAILSDGNCGSACSFMTRALHQQKGVRTYVYGGPLDVASGNSFPWCSFDGGPVAKESQIRAEVAGIANKLPAGSLDAVPGSAASWSNLVAADTLSLIPIAVNWSLPVSATYSVKNLDKMIEWTYEPATDLVNVGHPFEDRSAVWKACLLV